MDENVSGLRGEAVRRRSRRLPLHAVVRLAAVALASLALVGSGWAAPCGHCSAGNPDYALYCTQCGRRLGTVPPPPAPEMFPGEGPAPDGRSVPGAYPPPALPVPPSATVVPPFPPHVEAPPPPPTPPPPAPEEPPWRRPRLHRNQRGLFGLGWSRYRFEDNGKDSEAGITFRIMAATGPRDDLVHAPWVFVESALHTFDDASPRVGADAWLLHSTLGVAFPLLERQPQRQVKGPYLLAGFGLYMAGIDPPPWIVDDDVKAEFGTTWGLGFASEGLLFEWRRHRVELFDVPYDGRSFSVTLRF